MSCKVTHFSGGSILFMGKDLMVLNDCLIKWQKKITANKYKGNHRTKEVLALYMVLWFLKLGFATQNRDFAVMPVRPLNMSSPCSVLVKKETKLWKIQRKEERERK